MKRSVAEPRYAWGGETHHSVGKICEIESDGLLIIEIPDRPLPWQADPSDMEKVENFKVSVKLKISSPPHISMISSYPSFISFASNRPYANLKM